MTERWSTKLPEQHIPRCLITIQPRGQGPDTRIVTYGWVGDGKIIDCGVAWMPEPEHVARDQRGWLSEYRGDDLPRKDDWYLVCHERMMLPKMVWYNAKKSSFGGGNSKYGEVIAWRPLPKPYMGNNR